MVSDIDRTCRIAVYSINATDPENVLIDRVGRLPLERGNINVKYGQMDIDSAC